MNLQIAEASISEDLMLSCKCDNHNQCISRCEYYNHDQCIYYEDVTFYHPSIIISQSPPRTYYNPTPNAPQIPSHSFIFTHLTIQIRPHCPPKLRRPLPKNLRQVLQIIPRRDPKLPHKVLRRALEVAVILLSPIVLLAPKIRVRGDGTGALEALEPRLGLGLCGGVEGAFAEELV